MSDEIRLTEAQADRIREIAEEVGGGAYEQQRPDGDRELRVYIPQVHDDHDDGTLNNSADFAKPTDFGNVSQNRSAALHQRIIEIRRDNEILSERAALAVVAGEHDKALAAEAQSEFINS